MARVVTKTALLSCHAKCLSRQFWKHRVPQNRKIELTNPFALRAVSSGRPQAATSVSVGDVTGDAGLSRVDIDNVSELIRRAGDAFIVANFEQAQRLSAEAIELLDDDSCSAHGLGNAKRRGVMLNDELAGMLLAAYGVQVRSHLRLDNGEAARVMAQRARGLKTRGRIDVEFALSQMKFAQVGPNGTLGRAVPLSVAAQQVPKHPGPRRPRTRLERVGDARADAAKYAVSKGADEVEESEDSIVGLSLEAIEARVEQRLAQAMAAGDFDNIEGKGRPLTNIGRDVVADLYKKNKVLPQWQDKLNIIREELDNERTRLSESWYAGGCEPTVNFVKQKDVFKRELKALNWRIQLNNIEAPAAARAPLYDLKTEVNQAKQQAQARFNANISRPTFEAPRLRFNGISTVRSQHTGPSKSMWARIADAFRGQ